MINKVTLIGRLGGDPEVRHLENGIVVTRFSFATSESYKDKDGAFQEITEWHNIVIWRDLAERAGKNLKKGMLCFIEGKISYREYKDKDGIDRKLTDIVVSTFRMLEKREGSGQNADNRFPSAENAPPPRSIAANAEAAAMPVGSDAPPAPGDDLPF